MKTVIRLIACTQITIGARKLEAPSSAESTRGRARHYIYEAEVGTAKAFVSNGMMKPAYDDDAKTLTDAGVACASFYGSGKGVTEDPEPKKAQAPEPTPEPTPETPASAAETPAPTPEPVTDEAPIVVDAPKPKRRKKGSAT